MNYDEIVNALKQDKVVHWSNEGYIVNFECNELHVIFERNGYYTKLQDSEYADCFIGAVKQ